MMPIILTAITASGNELQWNYDTRSIDTIAELIRALRGNEPSIVRVIVDIALPPTGDIP